MKKIVLLLLIALAASHLNAMAQHLILGERAPELKSISWLNEQQPASTEMTYVEFYQSSNKTCKLSLDKLKALTEKLDNRLRVVVITRETTEVITPLLTPYLSALMGIALDPTGKTFAAFGVNYLPFGVLTDAKNRVLWMGNSLQLTETIIKQSK